MKKIKLKNAINSAIIAGVIAIPMVLFVVINTFDLNEIHIGPITIPRVYQNRYQEVATILSPEFVKTIKDNFIYNAKILLYQDDGTHYNFIPFFGIVYIFSLPFTIIGLYDSIKNRNMEKNILNFWFIASILLLIICAKANINRLNIIMMPLIIYTVLGIYYIVKNDKNTIIPIVAMYTVSFVLFCYNYKFTQGKSESVFEQGIEKPLQYVAQLNVEDVYILKTLKDQPYIYTLFYTKTSPHEYIDTVEYSKQKVAFEKIKSFGKYKFFMPEEMNDENAVYIVEKEYEYDTNRFKEKVFGRYKVLEMKD